MDGESIPGKVFSDLLEWAMKEITNDLDEEI